MKSIAYTLLFTLSVLTACSQNKKGMQDPASSGTDMMAKSDTTVHFRKLTPEETAVIVNKGTEAPFTGKYDNFFGKGVYVCKRCGAPLFRSNDKFDAHCGWPSFDDAIPGAVKRLPDPDGMRTEIECARCGAHLGHVFFGEGFTDKDERNCVNSISLVFIPDSTAQAKHMDMDPKRDTAVFAGGCFWGVQYFMQKAPGVISTEVGYAGGKMENPTYMEVASHTTGYAEAVQVIFDPSKTTYKELAKYFFDIHDPTQVNRQGPDIGENYRSEIFYKNNDQKSTAEMLIQDLEKQGYDVATKIEPAGKFWKAEEYHQNYYLKEGGTPYCHKYVNRFGS